MCSALYDVILTTEEKAVIMILILQMRKLRNTESHLQSLVPVYANTVEGLVGSPCSPRESQESSPTPQFKSITTLGRAISRSSDIQLTDEEAKSEALRHLCKGKSKIYDSHHQTPSSEVFPLTFQGNEVRKIKGG